MYLWLKIYSFGSCKVDSKKYVLVLKTYFWKDYENKVKNEFFSNIDFFQNYFLK